MTDPASKPEPAPTAGPVVQVPVPVAVSDRAGKAMPTSARELRRIRARKLSIRFALWVGLPTLLAIVYYVGLASPQYDSTTVIAIQSNDGHADDPRAKGGTAHQRDSRLLRDHIRSRVMLEQLTADHDLVRHYQSDSIDWWSRLDGDAGADETHKYYAHKVNVTVDPLSSALEVRVRAFTPARAQELLTAIVAAAEVWVRELSDRARTEQIDPAEKEVARARERLVAARLDMLTLTGGAEPRPEQMADPKVMEHELALLALEGALETLQTARLEAVRGQRFLVVVEPPTMPDQASRPRPLWDIATVLVTSLVLVSVLSLLGAAVREHANF